jgi:hypothetical protein
MRGSPACAVEHVRHRQGTLGLAGCVAQLIDIASSTLGRPVYTGLKNMKGLAPHPRAIILRPLASHTLKWMHVCEGGERHFQAFLPLPPRVCSKLGNR